MIRRYPQKYRRWTKDQLAQLRKLASEQVPTPLISRELGRTQASIYAKASELGIRLTPRKEWAGRVEVKRRSEPGPTLHRRIAAE